MRTQLQLSKVTITTKSRGRPACLRHHRETFIYALVVAPSIAIAQKPGTQPTSPPTESSSASTRAECARARSGIEGRRLMPRDTVSFTRLYIVGRCSESAGAVLPAIWRSTSETPPDSSTLTALIGASSNVRDGRIASTLLAIAMDRAKPQLIRQAAISALSVYVKPRLRCRVIPSHVRGEQFAVDCANAVDVGVVNGAIPVESNFKPNLDRLLDEIATEKTNVSLARLASGLRAETTTAR